MNIRRCIALLLSFTLLLFLPACHAGIETTDSSSNDNVLRVCFDSHNSATENERYMYDFMVSFKQATGIEAVEFEYLPSSGVERETAIQRIRTEMMSGTGPDVFLVRCGNADDALFPYPEKVMEAGLFLPLDEYMENNTEFTEWDKQQQVVLAAGRNEEGQQIIPLSYTFPLQVYPKAELDVEKPDHLLTFDEALADPEWSSLYTEFYDCRPVYSDGPEEIHLGYAHTYLQYIVGKWADFETEELLFTEEELLSVIQRILKLSENSTLEADYFDIRIYETNMGSMVPQYNQPATMIPLYSMNGGVTVSVESIAAINRNTKMPQEAYKFIDFFMRKQTQLNSHVYRGFCLYSGIPLYTDVFREDSPYQRHDYLKDESFAELTDIKDQITAANFRSELTSDLNTLMMDCWRAQESGQPIEEIVHEAYVQMQRKLRE